MHVHFLQSKKWQIFQEAVGRRTWRIAGEVLVVEYRIPFGMKYLYSAGAKYHKQILEEISQIAQGEKAIFFKFEPMAEDETLGAVLIKDGFQKSKKEIQPQKTTIIKLGKEENELLGSMNSKTRYNIGLAQKRGVHIRVSLNPSGELDFFWQLLQKTAKRDNFSTHTKEYYQTFLRIFQNKEDGEPSAELFFAELNGDIIAASIVLFFGERAFYLHGASDSELRQHMAPHLLQFEVMREARKRGCKIYDLWGIDEKKWPGVTRFKRGFGGLETERAGSYDYIFQPFTYFFYKLRGSLFNGFF